VHGSTLLIGICQRTLFHHAPPNATCHITGFVRAKQQCCAEHSHPRRQFVVNSASWPPIMLASKSRANARPCLPILSLNWRLVVNWVIRAAHSYTLLALLARDATFVSDKESPARRASRLPTRGSSWSCSAVPGKSIIRERLPDNGELQTNSRSTHRPLQKRQSHINRLKIRI